MLNFDLKTETEGTSALISIRGDLDLQVAERVVDTLTRIESTEPALLVIDLSGISFMDSTGMGVIATAHAHAEEAGRRFVIVRPPAGVRQAFELSRLDTVITTVDELADVYP
jgi:stage II sporulation protein AA (anti-sigma F factor antagonist)